MSRIEDYSPDDTASFLRSCAFGHNISQAVAGKKGHAFLKELEAALLALPVKRLSAGALSDAREDWAEGKRTCEATGDVCALGAVAVARAVAAGEDRAAFLQKLALKYDPEEGGWALTKEAAHLLKISHPLAYAVVTRNDESGARTPEERYQIVLDWVRRKLAGEKEY